MNDVATGIRSAETRTLVRDVVERVVLGRGEIQIISKAAAAPTSSGEADAPKVHTVPAPAPSLAPEGKFLLQAADQIPRHDA